MLCTKPADTSADELTPTFGASLDLILAGFGDYTNDQRGDVGSFVRTVACDCVGAILPYLEALPREIVFQDFFLTQARLDKIVSALLKQGVERLDNVRELAGRTLYRLACVEVLHGDDSPALRGKEMFRAIQCVRRVQFTLTNSFRSSGIAGREWRDFDWTSKKVLPFLSIPEYRTAVLEGAAPSVVRIPPTLYSADVLQSTHKASSPLLDFARSLPPFLGTQYSLLQLVDDVCTLGRQSWSANRVVVPVLNTLAMLLANGLLEPLATREEGRTAYVHTLGGHILISDRRLAEVLALAARSFEKVKSAPRLLAIIKMYAHLALRSADALAASPASCRLSRVRRRQRRPSGFSSYTRGPGYVSHERSGALTESRCASRRLRRCWSDWGRTGRTS